MPLKLAKSELLENLKYNSFTDEPLICHRNEMCLISDYNYLQLFILNRSHLKNQVSLGNYTVNKSSLPR